ncbi:unnamed protein product [Cylicostephanus goldi]|uniref:Aminotransferase class V domain-containing protein n=1 Tax=Cylicostephanus goldi TaxID=71465 RepID=A0A3P7NB29_CYLGO|nr:unnamed protein product [Cylicostephanus goldi]
MFYSKYIRFLKVQTGGGGTGEFWAHSHWNLPTPPDIVTFSKKLITGGYFYGEHMRVKEAYRIYNTWMGDPSKLFLLQKVIEVIKRDNLVEKTKEVGKYFQQELNRLQRDNLVEKTKEVGKYFQQELNRLQVRKYSTNHWHDAKEKPFQSAHSSIFAQARGMGTFAAIDLPDAGIRDLFVTKAIDSGLHCGGCGEKSVRFRPALIYGKKHAEITFDILEKAVKQI